VAQLPIVCSMLLPGIAQSMCALVLRVLSCRLTFLLISSHRVADDQLWPCCATFNYRTAVHRASRISFVTQVHRNTARTPCASRSRSLVVAVKKSRSRLDCAATRDSASEQFRITCLTFCQSFRLSQDAALLIAGHRSDSWDKMPVNH
jgi:hypothetical protein